MYWLNMTIIDEKEYIMTRKWTMPTDAEIEAQIAKAKHYRIIRYLELTECFKIRLLNEQVVEVPLNKTPELQGRTLEELRGVVISSHGMSLHWEDLDVDYGLERLLK